MSNDLLESIFGTRDPNPRTPQEAAHPQKRFQTAAHPIVGLQAPPSPPPGPTLDEKLTLINELLARSEARNDKLAYWFEVYTEMQRAQRDRDIPYREDVPIPTAPSFYNLRTHDRPYVRIYVGAYRTVIIQSLAVTLTELLIPGWNILDIADQSRITSTSGAEFNAIVECSYTPFLPEPIVAVPGYVSNAVVGTTNIGTDSPFTVTCGHWMLQNNTAASLQWEIDQSTNVASPTLAAGQMLSSDVPIISGLHLLTAAAQPVNQTGSNIVFRAWN